MLSSADMALARRIEAGHATSGRAFAAEAEPFAGGWAIFAGVGTLVTQAIGVGMNGPVAAEELDRLEGFYHTRGSDAILDLCTLADASVHGMIGQRGYTVREISHVLARRLDSPGDIPAGIGMEETEEAEAWGRMVLEGFMDGASVSEEQIAMVTGVGVCKYFTLWNGVRSGAAGMKTDSGLATLFADSTLVDARGHGLHLASIRHRVREAAGLGCDLASASVFPGGTSHRNYERAGFQMLYARVMVGLTAK